MTKTERFLKDNYKGYMKEKHALLVAEMNGDFPKAGAVGDGLACMMCLASLIRQRSKQTGHTNDETRAVIEEILYDVENE